MVIAVSPIHRQYCHYIYTLITVKKRSSIGELFSKGLQSRIKHTLKNIISYKQHSIVDYLYFFMAPPRKLPFFTQSSQFSRASSRSTIKYLTSQYLLSPTTSYFCNFSWEIPSLRGIWISAQLSGDPS